MTITNEPIILNQPINFIVKGWPDEDAVKAAIERFYNLKQDAFKEFFVKNSFEEVIMSGKIDGQNKIMEFKHHERHEKVPTFSEPGDR